VDQCDNCKFYRVMTRVVSGTPTPPPVLIPECRFSDPFMNGWPQVKPDDWCGKYVVIGVGLTNQYINGTALASDTEPHPLLVKAEVGIFNVVIMRGCQLINTSTKEDCLVEFLDGNDPDKPLGYAGCGAYETRDFVFDPGIRASIGNDIWVKAGSAVPSGLSIAAQGFVLRG